MNAIEYSPPWKMKPVPFCGFHLRMRRSGRSFSSVVVSSDLPVLVPPMTTGMNWMLQPPLGGMSSVCRGLGVQEPRQKLNGPTMPSAKRMAQAKPTSCSDS